MNQHYGVLHFGDPREFERRLTPEEELQQALVALDMHMHAPPMTDWPRLVDCTRRGTGYSLDARTPAIRASLRFDPSSDPFGNYEIHLAQQRRHEVGRVVQVTAVADADLYMHQYQALRDYPIRYAIVTSTHAGMQRVWLIGILSVRPPKADDDEKA